MLDPFNNDEESCSAHVRAMALPVFKRSVQRSGMSPESFVQALSQTSLSQLPVWSEVDLETLLLAAERHGLSPLGREMFLVRAGDQLTDPPLVVVGVDGWSKVLNSHKKFAGMQFLESQELVDGLPAWIECTIHRWDRRVPTRVREYLAEDRGNSLPWLTHPRRMLRHKALVQCARLAFGLVGVYDHDEAQRIRSGTLGGADNRAQKGPRAGGANRIKTQMGVGALKQFLDSQNAKSM